MSKATPRPRNKRQILITGKTGKSRNGDAWQRLKAINNASSRSPEAVRDSISLLEAEADMSRLGTTWWSRKFPDIAGGG